VILAISGQNCTRKAAQRSRFLGVRTPVPEPWSFDIGSNGTKNITEVQVDARDGKIVSVQTESLRAQAKEAAGEKSKR